MIYDPLEGCLLLSVYYKMARGVVVTLELSISDSKLVKPKCVFQLYNEELEFCQVFQFVEL